MLLLAARRLLAAVFVVAGVAKLADRSGSRQALRDFGAPVPLAGPLALLLPLAELAVAGALLPTRSAWLGALGALSLLLLFSVAIGVNLARGRRPDCHCLGRLSSSPIGASTLLRNGALALLAGLVVSQGRSDAGASALAWLGDLTLAERVALFAGLFALARGALALWPGIRRRVRPAPSPSGLPVGAPAPAFRLRDLDGETVSVDALRAAGKPLLLAFVDPHCDPCEALLPELARWQRERAESLTVAVISRGSRKENLAKGLEHGLATVLLQEDREVSEAYQAHGTPSAVLVRSDGTVGSPLSQGAEAIRALVGEEAEELSAAPQVGEPAPALRLPDLAGETVDLADFRGAEALVLFFAPDCGFCREMLPDLLAWEADPPPGAPSLLVVSTGTVEDNRAMGMRSPVVLERGFETGSAFGAAGTPSAVLVDREGRIASPVVVGAEDVLALAGVERKARDAEPIEDSLDPFAEAFTRRIPRLEALRWASSLLTAGLFGPSLPSSCETVWMT